VNAAGHIALQVRADPPYRRALSRWQQCMNRRGLYVDSPQAARTTAAHEAERGGRRAEVSVAVVDAGCARSTQLVAIAQATERRLWAEADPHIRDQVRACRSSRLAALPQARAIARRASTGGSAGTRAGMAPR
jgi:hypothetical protein